MSTRLPAAQRRQASAVARLAAANPFSDRWTELEREALGAAFAHRERPWSLGAEGAARTHNVEALERLTRELVERLARSLATGEAPAEDAALYRELALFDLFNRSTAALDELVDGGATKRVRAFPALKAAFDAAFAVDRRAHPGFGAAHWFAGCFQLRRAFLHTFRFIVGTSRATARLRGAVWEAVFTADVARYRRALFERMRDVPALILGETGTGKELVARAVGLSGYVPFLEDALAFAGEPGEAFFPLHLAAVSPTLVESALFGHKRGAFTGALEDREGVFAACPPWGTVFLDEIGEIDEALQTKLLRVLETRDFAPLGQNRGARFRGRVVSATNRELARAVDGGGFRRDVYFRLAGVVLRTPPLRERLEDDPDELQRLVRFLAAQHAGETEAGPLADAALGALAAVPTGYAWPGNVRELSQHVRAVLVHGAVDPRAFGAHGADAEPSWLGSARAGSLTVDELVTQYVRHVHAIVGTFDGTARRLGVDRRTVKARVGR